MPLEINTLLLPDENDILLTDVSRKPIPFSKNGVGSPKWNRNK